MSSFVVISGIPGSGKSTIGRAIAAELRWPLLDKDDYLEALFRESGGSTIEERQSLSRESDALFETDARSAGQAVLCSFWRPPNSKSSSGTPSSWLCESRFRVLEVVCRCPFPIAAQRFLSRARHSGHHDGAWNEASLLAQSKRVDAHLPLGVGALLEYDTTGSASAESLCRNVLAWATASQGLAADAKGS